MSDYPDPPKDIIQRGDLIVTSTVHEVHLAQAYLRMLEEGTLGIVFHQQAPSMRDFLAEFLTPGNRIVCACFRELPNQKPELCGLAWAFQAKNMGRFKRCELGEVFFRRQSDPRNNLDFAKMALSLFFDISKIDVAFGVTPAPNKLALRFARKLGFRLIGPIPQYAVWENQLCDAWLSHMSREDWIERNRPLPASLYIRTFPHIHPLQ